MACRASAGSAPPRSTFALLTEMERSTLFSFMRSSITEGVGAWRSTWTQGPSRPVVFGVRQHPPTLCGMLANDTPVCGTATHEHAVLDGSGPVLASWAKVSQERQS